MKSHGVIRLENFIRATRDSGYKTTASSIAELIDNSFEADARNVDINISDFDGEIRVVISDNGCGMSPSDLRLALQFGGSSRFDSRQGSGRYGMGLPNSSLSRARRIDVYTWRRRQAVWRTHLDLDEITAGRANAIASPKRISPSSVPRKVSSKSGTVIVWSKCDRLDRKVDRKTIAKIERSLGQIFRKELWRGRSIKINGQRLLPIDPLFLVKGNNLIGATLYGQQLRYDVRVPDGNGREALSPVIVTFSELPIEEWHSYSNDEKRRYRISKRAGVSIVRAGREIDYGWFFMGSKRKENYDDWWRCQIEFDPRLDELFGVTHTKQEIRPTEMLNSMLSPDIERVAHTLNTRVRRRYLKVRASEGNSAGRRIAETRDPLLEPLGKSSCWTKQASRYQLKFNSQRPRGSDLLRGLSYRIEHRALPEPSFFVPVPCSKELIVLVNEEHPFFERVYNRTESSSAPEVRAIHTHLELLLFAAARAECSVTSLEKLRWARSMREAWSKTLAAFLD